MAVNHSDTIDAAQAAFNTAKAAYNMATGTAAMALKAMEAAQWRAAEEAEKAMTLPSLQQKEVAQLSFDKFQVAFDEWQVANLVKVRARRDYNVAWKAISAALAASGASGAVLHT